MTSRGILAGSGGTNGDEELEGRMRADQLFLRTLEDLYRRTTGMPSADFCINVASLLSDDFGRISQLAI
jgi:hypothetical protein